MQLKIINKLGIENGYNESQSHEMNNWIKS